MTELSKEHEQAADALMRINVSELRDAIAADRQALEARVRAEEREACAPCGCRIYDVVDFDRALRRLEAVSTPSAEAVARAAAEELDRLALLYESGGDPMTAEQLAPVVAAIISAIEERK
jgi:hypothetical protein